MKAVDYSLRFLALLLAMFCAFSLYLLPTKLEAVLSTIEESRKILAQFHAIRDFSEAFVAKNGKLPDNDQVSEWYYEKYEPGVKYIAAHSGLAPFSVDSPNCADSLKTSMHPPNANAFCIWYWRGEWSEHYASWSNESSLTFNPNDYYLTGTIKGEGLAYGAFFIGSIFFAWRGFAKLLVKLGRVLETLEAKVRGRQT